MSRKPHRREIADPNLSAFRVIEHMTRNEPTRPSVVPLARPKNAAAVALGRKGGLKSRAGRMAKISPEERRRIASHAARTRWEKESDGD